MSRDPIPCVALLLATLALGALAGGGAPPAFAAGGDLIWVFQGIEDIHAIDEIEDQDADGVPDVMVETYDAGASGDHLYCLSGATPNQTAVTIWSTKPVGGLSSGGGWGDECMRTTPDVSGDGIEDVLLGTAWGGRTAYAIDGTDGSVIWDFDTYADSPPNPPASGWVYTMASIPDATGDGIPDVFFGAGSDNDRVYHANGATGAILWNLNLGDAIYSSVALDDVSGDGNADCAVGVGDNADAVWVVRGGSTLVPLKWQRDLTQSVQALGRIEDISGDSTNDLIVGTWDAAIIAFDGTNGDTLWAVGLGPRPVMRIAILDDVNGDGEEDVAVGSWDNRVLVHSGLDGGALWDFPAGDDVWTVDRVDDVNGDGVNDVVAGSFDGNVYVLDGVTGGKLWSFQTGNRLYFVKGVSDLTGNGVPDVVAGTQFLSSGGRAYLLEGGDDPATPADLFPLLVKAGPAGGAIEVTLENAYSWERCAVERHDGAGGASPARARFRESILEAQRSGEITTAEAVQARSQDPEIRWTRLPGGPLGIADGRVSFVDRSAEAGRTYTYRFAFLSGDGTVGFSPSVTVTVGAPVAAIPPIRVSPNPSDGVVTIEFALPSPQVVRLDVVDVTGRRVATVSEPAQARGNVRLGWNGAGPDGTPLPNGVYFLRLEGEGFVSTEKLALLR